MREALAPSLQATAHDLVLRLAARPERAVVIFGHSLGAITALEAARQLTAGPRGRWSVRLVVSARQAPHLLSLAPDTLSDADLVAWAAPQGGFGRDLDESVAAVLLPALRADLALSASYTWNGGRVPVPVTAVAYAQDPLVDIGSVSAWSAATSAGFRVCVLEGGHLDAREGPTSLLGIVGDEVAALERPDADVVVVKD